MSSKKIIENIRHGNNRKAIKALYKAFPSIKSYICKNGGDMEDAKDIFHDALMVFHQNAINKHDFALTCSVNTYLYRVAMYMWKDRLKKKNKIQSIDFDAYSVSIEDGIEVYLAQEEKFNLLDKILLNIGKNCLEILTKYYLQKMSMAEIAKAMDYSSVNVAKTRKYKCIEKAKKILSEL